MRSTSENAGFSAIKSNGEAVSNGASRRTNYGTADKDDTWFSAIAQQLVPSNAGLVLHYLTGLEERTCYRYAAGDSQPSGWFITELLNSDQGEVWLSAFLDRRDPKWWRVKNEKAKGFDDLHQRMAALVKAASVYSHLKAELRE